MASKSVKTVTRLTKKSGGTKGEAKGVVQNLRHGTYLSPRGQIKRSTRVAKDEGLGAKKVAKLRTAEKKIAARATARQAKRIGVAMKPSTPSYKTPRQANGRVPKGKTPSGFKPTK